MPIPSLASTANSKREGVIATAPGRGSFVSQNGALENARRVALDVATRAIDEAVREARSLGITHDEIARDRRLRPSRAGIRRTES